MFRRHLNKLRIIMPSRFDRCSNPFNCVFYFRKKGLLRVSSRIHNLIPHLPPNTLLCATCRKRISAGDIPRSDNEVADYNEESNNTRATDESMDSMDNFSSDTDTTGETRTANDDSHNATNVTDGTMDSTGDTGNFTDLPDTPIDLNDDSDNHTDITHAKTDLADDSGDQTDMDYETIDSPELLKNLTDNVEDNIFLFAKETSVNSITSSISLERRNSFNSRNSCCTLERNDSDISLNTKLPILNEALALLDNSPIPRKRLALNERNNVWKANKVQTISESWKNLLSVTEIPQDEDTNDLNDMISRLKSKYHPQSTNFAMKIQILTILPVNWSIIRIAETMNTTMYTAKLAKTLAASNGILAIPKRKIGNNLSRKIITAVIDFYESDDISALLSGKKDFLSVITPEGRVHKQKRRLLGNLNELYSEFKERNPEMSIGISMFASLRPKQCISVGPAGTHTICVCPIHQNFKLMLMKLDISSIVENVGRPSLTYEDVLFVLMCHPFSYDCYLGTCSKCPGVEALRAKLTSAMMSSSSGKISYKKWVSKPRCALTTIDCDIPSFINDFCDQAKILRPHSYITKQQSSYLRYIKDKLKPNECVITCDFAENYAFVVQEAAPGFH